MYSVRMALFKLIICSEKLSRDWFVFSGLFLFVAFAYSESDDDIITFCPLSRQLQRVIPLVLYIHIVHRLGYHRK